MRYDLASMVKRAGKRRKSVALPVIIPPQHFAKSWAGVYMQVVRAWDRIAKEAILPAYQRALDQMIRDDVGDVETTVSFGEAEITRLIFSLTPDMREIILRVEKWQRAKWVQNVLTAGGVDLSTLVGPEDVRVALETVLARNVALIKDVGRQQQSRMVDATFRALQRRAPAAELARELTQISQMSRRRALGIASDQLQKLSAELDRERRRQAGIDEWIWRHSEKAHPRPVHVARDGKHYTDATAPDDLPGELPYCGCKAQPFLDLGD